MNIAQQPVPGQYRPLGMNPLKFATWLFIVSIVMIFASLTSAYVVRRGEGNWLEFELPSLFWINSLILIISSITMHIAYLQAKKDNLGLLRSYIAVTFFLGIIF